MQNVALDVRQGLWAPAACSSAVDGAAAALLALQSNSSKQPVSISCFVISLFVNLLEKQDIICCTTTAFTAAELRSQLQLVSRSSCDRNSKYTAASTATFGFPAAQWLTGSHVQAMLHTCCGADAAALSAKKWCLSCGLPSAQNPSACCKHLCGQVSATLCGQLFI